MKSLLSIVASIIIIAVTLQVALAIIGSLFPYLIGATVIVVLVLAATRRKLH